MAKLEDLIIKHNVQLTSIASTVLALTRKLDDDKYIRVCELPEFSIQNFGRVTTLQFLQWVLDSCAKIQESNGYEDYHAKYSYARVQDYKQWQNTTMKLQEFLGDAFDAFLCAQ